MVETLMSPLRRPGDEDGDGLGEFRGQAEVRLDRLEADLRALLTSQEATRQEITLWRLTLADAFVPRREFEDSKKQRHADAEQVDRRIGKLELVQARATWLLITVMAGLVVDVVSRYLHMTP